MILTGASGFSSVNSWRLTSLTPGDFAVVDRQRRLNQIDSAEAVLSALRRECSFKEGEIALLSIGAHSTVGRAPH